MSSVYSAEEQVANEQSLNGTVKWFDPVKGYGFIVPDDGTEDVLIHHSTLRRSGHDILYPGARVKCSVVQKEQGFQAELVVAVDNSDAILPHQERRPTTVMTEVSDVGDFEKAIVKWFNRIRGFGFLNVEIGGADIFVHMEVLREADIEALVPGQYVMVRYGRGPKGYMATEVQRLAGNAENPENYDAEMEQADDDDAPQMVANVSLVDGEVD